MRVVALAFSLVALCASPARANTDEDAAAAAHARQHYAEAQALYERGAIEQAMASFQAAYAAMPDPALLFDLGQCHRRLGHRAEALAAYRAFQQQRPDSDKRPVVERLIASLEREEQLLAARPAAARPLYRRWWWWTAVGGTAVAALAIGLGVGLAPAQPTASTTVPAFRF